MKYHFALLLLIFVISSCTAGVYAIRPDLSEEELCSLYVDMLLKYSQYAETKWHPAPWSDNAGYWGNGISGGNEGIRAVANTALVFAVLANHTNALSPAEKERYRARAIAGIRYIAETHSTGNQVCVDGQKWTYPWQSAMWAANMAFAAWILWDDLDDALRQSVERVVVYEANRFLDRDPPGRRWGNTAAEEVGWDQILLSLAPNMFPKHPNAPRWRERSIQYMMNTLSVPQDLKDERIVDGRRVRDWICAVNVHPDFTIENHGFLHPSYTMVSPAEVGQGALMYLYAGNPIPEAAGHHLLDNWHMLQGLMLPSGYWAYPQGMDWALNSDGHIHYLAWLATYAKDPVAAGMERRVAQYTAGHQKIHGGAFAGPSSRLGFAREAVWAERIAYALLFHRYLASTQERRTIEQVPGLLGVKRYILSDVITHRTGSKFVSFSWKNKVMGLVIPIGPGHEDNPYFTTPPTNGLVGSVDLKDQPGKDISVVHRSWHKTADGFETSGVIRTNGGALEQRIKLLSVGDRTVIYADRVIALRDVTVTQECGVLAGIENDEFTGDRRVLYYQGGSQVITGPATSATIRIPGNWANVDGRLGLISVSGSGLAYRDVPQYNRDGAREDYLYGSYSDAPRAFKSGEEIARRVAVFFVETSPDETARLAGKVRLTGSVLSLALPEGATYTVDLQSL